MWQRVEFARRKVEVVAGVDAQAGVQYGLRGFLELPVDRVDVGPKGAVIGFRNNTFDNADGLLVTVMWDDDGTGANGTNCGPDPEVDLTCYTLAVAQ